MKTILLVEDDLDSRTIYRMILEVRGYKVLQAEDGKTAVRLARAFRPDLILMDMEIPEIDGWEATRLLKADPRTASIPVIAVSAYAQARDEARSKEVGCTCPLAKPIGPAQLVEVMEGLLRQLRD